MKLVVVESPNKVKAIQRYLGEGYEVRATCGHVRDLPDDALGVEVATFEPSYVVIADKARGLGAIRAAAARASEVLLATDADREGEAISWHVMQALRLKSARRVRFTEITAKALKAAVAAAGVLDQNLVDAQQARRVLDRLVGFQVSPLLGTLGLNHSAGRVQSATLHLVVERERAREAFRPVPYWTLKAKYANGLVARFATMNAKGDLVETRLSSKEEAEAVLARARGPHVVASIEGKPVERQPKPPFTTSTLQQAASVQLGLRPERTMALAQALFEKGAISYHRTDSVQLSDDAVKMAREFLAADYPEALPPSPRLYRGKDSAQEAHEAIRPTSLSEKPDELSDDEARLYELIRARFIACQCKAAILAQTTVAIQSGTTTWRARGAVVTFPSFLKYLTDDEDSEAKPEEEPEPRLPTVKVGETLVVSSLESARQETKPQPRFTQASLIREMERAGIGRPATYAQTVKVLFAREYLGEEKRFVFPTARGRLVDQLLAAAFSQLVLASYTAQMEERLDEVAAGKRRWKDALRGWYAAFAGELERAPGVIAAQLKASPALVEALPEAPKRTGRPCPRCGAELLLRPGSRGAFLSCSAYPRCEYAADPSAKASSKPCPKCAGKMEELSGKFGAYARCLSRECGGRLDLSPVASEPCPLCAGPMRSRGEFLSCARYPACTGALDVKALARAKKLGRRCPTCGALLLERKGKRGAFLGCSRYPACRHIEDLRGAAEARR